MRKWKQFPAACLLLSLAAGAVAQSPPNDPNEPVSSSNPPAGEQSPDANPGDQRERSPFDYKSSEEISEDLSVSFPVDI